MAELKDKLNQLRENEEQDEGQVVEEGESKTEGAPAHRKGEDPLTSRGYSFVRLLSGIVNKDFSEAKVERETHEHLVDLGYEGAEGEGFLVPVNARAMSKFHEDNGDKIGNMGQREFVELMTREYDPRYYSKRQSVVTEDDQAAALVQPEQSGDFIDLLRNKTVMDKAGATELELPNAGQLDIPKMASGSTAYWLGEQDALDLSEVDTGLLRLRPNYLGALVKVSKHALRHATPSLEAMIRNDMANAMAQKQDETFLYGPDVSGTATVSVASDSDVPQGIKQLGTEKNIDVSNSINDVIDLWKAMTQFDPTAWVMNKAEMANLYKLIEGTSSQPHVLLPSPVDLQFFGAEDILLTEQVQDNHAFVGDFSEAIIARDFVMEVSVNDQAANAFTKNQMWLKAMLGCDFGMRHSEAVIYNYHS